MQSNSLPLLQRLPQIRGSYRENVDLSRLNWFRIGGLAEIVFRPEDKDDLVYFLQHVQNDIPITVLGVGSNLLVRDGGIDGVVIRLGRDFASCRVHEDTLYAGAATLCFNIAMMAADSGIAGCEFLSGIPGTIGGALHMNAGAYGSDISSLLVYADAIDNSGQLHHLTPQDIGYIYRGHTLPEGMIFIGGLLHGHITGEEPAIIKARIEDITKMRSETQPIRSRTSGSTFKNPQGHKAWELIDAAGCRGLKVGDAQVSEKHCNFFINTGHATAHDVETLGEEVRRRVKEQSGVMLEWEVQIIGKHL